MAAFGIVVLILAGTIQNNTFAQSAINGAYGSAGDGALKGVLGAYKNTEVATAEVGVIRELFVKPGDYVEAGQKLARLDDDQQRMLVNEAEIDLATQGMLESARSEVAFNQARYDKTLSLAMNGKASKAELERDELELRIAAAKLHAQEDAKKISQARLDKALTQFNNRTVVAPHSGYVVEIMHDVGEYVAGNGPAVVRLLDTSTMRARFFLTGELAAKMRSIKTVDVRLANNIVLQGEIEFVSPVADPESDLTEMTVLVKNVNGDIRSSACDLIRP